MQAAMTAELRERPVLVADSTGHSISAGVSDGSVVFRRARRTET